MVIIGGATRPALFLFDEDCDPFVLGATDLADSSTGSRATRSSPEETKLRRNWWHGYLPFVFLFESVEERLTSVRGGYCVPDETPFSTSEILYFARSHAGKILRLLTGLRLVGRENFWNLHRLFISAVANLRPLSYIFIIAVNDINCV